LQRGTFLLIPFLSLRWGMRTVQGGPMMLGFSENLDYGPQFAAICHVGYPDAETTTITC
ncbi:MAG: hypothetical protein H0S77_11610, partial [Spirochaetaceae bacterium]|nr:hypothetical protein [Spirochaetaceae bacterium]